MRIVFFGTPDFAAISLKRLVDDGFDIAAVVTVADKPAGRGQKISTSPVKDYAQTVGLPILQPLKLKDDAFLQSLQEFEADLFVVVAFRMLPKEVWSMPRLGTINLHGSLLPNYRGAAPIHHAVMNGETESGCTTFFINERIDTGNLLEQCHIAIPDEATTGEVYIELAHQGAMLLSGTVDKLSRNAIQDIEQQLTGEEKSAPKIQRDDCKINWNQPAEKIYHFVRGLSPFPCAFTILNGETFKIYYTVRTNLPTIGPGKIQHDKKRLLVGTIDFMLEITDLQPAGKKRMTIDAFSAGNNLAGQEFN